MLVHIHCLVMTASGMCVVSRLPARISHIRYLLSAFAHRGEDLQSEAFTVRCEEQPDSW